MKSKKWTTVPRGYRDGCDRRHATESKVDIYPDPTNGATASVAIAENVTADDARYILMSVGCHEELAAALQSLASALPDGPLLLKALETLDVPDKSELLAGVKKALPLMNGALEQVRRYQA